MALKIYLNGKIVDEHEAVVSVFDHGLLYGDGVFEGIRAYNGKVFKLDEHITRLFESAKTILLDITMTKEEMKEAVLRTIRANFLKDAYIRLVVTRGCGDLGLSPSKCKAPTIFIIADKIKLYPMEYYDKGLDIITVSTRRNAPESIDPRIKSLNYLNNIIAHIEAANAGCMEAIMLNTEGYITECTGDNIFMVKNGAVITPPTYLGILDGITRVTVLTLARELGYEASEAVFTRHDVYNADECFLTGTAAEIMPIIKVDGRVIGGGKPGEITKILMNEYHRLTRQSGERVYGEEEKESV